MRFEKWNFRLDGVALPFKVALVKSYSPRYKLLKVIEIMVKFLPIRLGSEHAGPSRVRWVWKVCTLGGRWGCERLRLPDSCSGFWSATGHGHCPWARRGRGAINQLEASISALIDAASVHGDPARCRHTQG